MKQSPPWPYGVVMRTEKRGLPRKGYTKRLNGCWKFDGYKDRDGYGLVTLHPYPGYTTSQAAHRFFWTKWIGPLEPDIELDHKCRKRSCVNPKHLRPVTHQKNMELAKPFRKKLTHCKRGHEFREGNIYKWAKSRTCKTCHWASNYMRTNNVSRQQALRLMEKRLGTQKSLYR